MGDAGRGARARRHRLPRELGQDPAVNGASRLVGDVLYLAFFLAVGVAVVRHRLFDVDLVLNRTLVYGWSPRSSRPSTWPS